MRNFLLILWFLAGSSSFAQQIVKRPLDKYGISPGLALPVGNGVYKAGVSFDLSAYYSYSIGYNWSVAMPIGASILNTEEHDKNLNFRQTSLYMLPSVRKAVPQLDGSSLVLGAKPYYTLINRGNLSTSTPKIDLTNQMTRLVGIGAYAGIDINLRENSTLEIGYTYNFGNRDIGFINGAANHLSLKLNVNFNRSLTEESEKGQMKNSLMKLSKDTLYVISRMCPEDFSLAQLDSLFASFYSFSAYRVLSADEIDAVVKTASPIHFAVVGRYYKSKGDPETTGIYLLDSKMNPTKFPYPVWTYLKYNYLSKGFCFETIGNLANHITEFNRRLYNKRDN